MLRCHGSSQLVQLHFKNQFNYLNSRNFSYHINDNEKSVEINIPNGQVGFSFSIIQLIFSNFNKFNMTLHKIEDRWYYQLDDLDKAPAPVQLAILQFFLQPYPNINQIICIVIYNLTQITDLNMQRLDELHKIQNAMTLAFHKRTPSYLGYCIVLCGLYFPLITITTLTFHVVC